MVHFGKAVRLMKVDLFSFCICGFVSGFACIAIDIMFNISDKLFKKITGGSFRELYEDNKPDDKEGD